MIGIVLCGGLGTRLGELTRDTPKPMLLVAGRPFVAHILDKLSNVGLSGIIISVGFQWRKVREFVGYEWNGLPIEYSIEKIPLGTGGAIKKAMRDKKLKEALVFNGDTMFDIDVIHFIDISRKINSEICIALRKMDDCGRYGRVNINDKNRVLCFEEKGCDGPGLINGGVYFLKYDSMLDIDLIQFSFEADVLQGKLSEINVHGMIFKDFFIDIGIPSDLSRANVELSIAR